MKRVVPLALVCVVLGGAKGDATTFSFLGGGPFDGVDLSTRPGLTTNGITLTAVSATSPFSVNETSLGESVPASLTCDNRVGVNNPRISNVDYITHAGESDLSNESVVMNFLETMTFCFDRSVVFSQIRVTDLEAGEQLTVHVEEGPTAVFSGSSVWSIGSSGPTNLTGSALGVLENYIVARGAEVTFAFDAVNPLDRVSNGNGSAWPGTPSVWLVDFNADIPATFGLGRPFPVLGSSTQAVVGCELWGEAGTVSLVWSEDVQTQGWTHTNRLGALAPQIFTDAVMTNLTADTVYQYAFFATNSSGQTVWSSTNEFAWTTNLYVSPAGSDTNSGLSSNKPLQTIKEALKRVEKMARPAQPQAALPPDDLYEGIGAAYGDQLDAHLTNLAAAVTIRLLPGTYQLDELLVVDQSIGGGIHFEGEWAPGAEEVLRARLVEHSEDALWMDPPDDYMPVISGGLAITNWTATTVNGVDAWTADLPDVQTGSWYFQQLFVDGRRAERSRWPKQGWFRMESVNTNRLEFQAFPEHMQAWTNLTDVEAVILHYWFEDRLSVTNYNSVARQVQLAGPQPDYDLMASNPAHGIDTAAYYLDHVFETMSEPGEWYLNRTEGRLYYIPKAGETMTGTRVVAPVLRQLFQVKGALSVNQYLWDVRFSKIAFLHTRVAELEVHDGTGNGRQNIGFGALQFSAARAVGVEACLFGHLGEAGVQFGAQTLRGTAGCNIFRDMAGTALFAHQESNPTVQARTGFLRIYDNDVKGYGRFWHGNVGVMVTGGMYCTVEHNHIRDGYYNGVNVLGGTGGATNAMCFGTVVCKNRIHDVGQGWLSDLSGIYVPGSSPYSVIEGNVIYNIKARDYAASAVYLDGSSQYWTVRNNWFYGSNFQILEVKGWSHVFTNNVLGPAGLRSVKRHNADVADDPGYAPLGGAAGRKPPLFKSNIYLQSGGYSYDYSAYTQTPAAWGSSDTNLFWDMTGSFEVGDGVSLPAWRSTQNKDINSQEQDPQLMNSLRGDFRVDTNSPARTGIGYASVDNRDAGVRSNEWAAAGAVLFQPEASFPAWLPSDVPGLQCWLDASDLSAGSLAEWNNKMPYTYDMRQYDGALQPTVIPAALNGMPVVRFDGTDWMGNQEYLEETRQYAGRFSGRDFSVFTVYRPVGSGVVLTKGDGGSGKWSIGEQQNRFRWNGSNYIGSSGTNWQLRAWRRGDGLIRYYEGGSIVTQSSSSANADFSTDDVLCIGGRTNSTGCFFGDIAEVLIYMGSMSSDDFAAVTNYLVAKWVPQPAPFISNEQGALPGYGNAVLQGELTVSGTADVVFYWGLSDGGTNASAWEHADTNPASLSGTVAVGVSNLPSRVSYYYRCFASNSYGSAWASATKTFNTITLDEVSPSLLVRHNLHLWLDGADADGDGLAEGVGESGYWGGKLSSWTDKSPARYVFAQTNSACRPSLIMNTINGRPALHFNALATNWLENSAAQLGRFGTNDFLITTVHRSSGGSTTVMGKGYYGGSARWELGVSQNQFRWNSSNYLGQAGTSLMVRGYQRVSGVLTYSENGSVVASSQADGNHDFSSNDPLYIGRRGASGWWMDGDIAEILIYTGTVSSVESQQITDYLQEKWLAAVPSPRLALKDQINVWLDGDDLDGDGVREAGNESGVVSNQVAVWVDKSGSLLNVIQNEATNRPQYSTNMLNGRSLLLFDKTKPTWLASAGTGLVGKFGTNDFGIFTVHRSHGGITSVMGLGHYGGSGRWELGISQNQFRWNSTNYVGNTGTGFSVRCYRRINGVLDYSENGTFTSMATTDVSHNISGNDTFYIGRRGADTWFMDGEIAEVIIYTGTVSSAKSQDITDYLAQKWGQTAVHFGDELPPYTNRLHLWLDGADADGDGLAEGVGESGYWGGKLSSWTDKSPARYVFAQTNSACRPSLIMNTINGRPALHFNALATNWLENSAAQLGRFGTNDFLITTVHRSSGGSTTVMGKGYYGGSARWELGVSQNQFRWNSSNYLGQAGTSLMVRGYQRVSGVLTYSENGSVVASSQADGNHDFSSNDPLYIGRRGASGWWMDGDIAEILIYTGTVSSVESQQITDYLQEKWGGAMVAADALLRRDIDLSQEIPLSWVHDYKLIAEDFSSDLDSDHDGFNNVEEYLTGTDPVDPVSYFHSINITCSNGYPVVSWQGSSRGSSIPWSMYVCTNWNEGWLLIASNNIPRGSGDTAVWQDLVTPPDMFRVYRPAVLAP